MTAQTFASLAVKHNKNMLVKHNGSHIDDNKEKG